MAESTIGISHCHITPNANNDLNPSIDSKADKYLPLDPIPEVKGYEIQP